MRAGAVVPVVPVVPVAPDRDTTLDSSGYRYNPLVWHTGPKPWVGNNCYAFRNFLAGRFQLTGYDAALPR